MAAGFAQYCNQLLISTLILYIYYMRVCIIVFIYIIYFLSCQHFILIRIFVQLSTIHVFPLVEGIWEQHIYTLHTFLF